MIVAIGLILLGLMGLLFTSGRRNKWDYFAAGICFGLAVYNFLI